MFSANNFYQWTYETYLKDKVFSMLTYHPMGTRGYKNLQKWDLDLNENSDLASCEVFTNASVVMNDQEPVLLDYIKGWKKEHTPGDPYDSITDLYRRRQEGDSYWIDDIDKQKWSKEKDLFKDTVNHFLSITDDLSFTKLMFPGILKPILVHSELNSQDVQDIKSEFIPVYVFWHGLVSRDWYRHWKHNQQCRPNINRANNNKRFLLYARAWTGSRQYRLRFVEKIIEQNLHNSLKYNFFELDDGEYYREYSDTDIADYFTEENYNKQKKFFDLVFSGHMADNQKPEVNKTVSVNSNSSAYINVDDYTQTAVQIVAETLFETDKIYLTEKTFQPIVAGQPFLTLSAPGTLQTLKHYGFKTFDTVWDEAYDSEQDHDKRMAMVVEQIELLNNTSQDEFTALYEKCLAICEHNRQHFFSDKFEQQMLEEYDTNFKLAFKQQQEIAKTNPGGSRFWIADEICFNCYNTEFFYKQDQYYLKYMLARAREHSEEQYQAILEQYPWARKLTDVV